VTAELKGWYRIGKYYRGKIYNDRLKRFPNGKSIMTSAVKKESFGENYRFVWTFSGSIYYMKNSTRGKHDVDL